MKNVLVIGSLNMDLSIRVERVPGPGETVPGHGLSASAGGKGANQAAAAAKLGVPVRMLGAVGRDSYGAQLRTALRGCGVDCAAVEEREAPPGLAMITVCRGENRIVIDHGANAALLPQAIDAHADLLEWADLVVMQLEIPLETVEHAARRARAAGARVILNPAPAEGSLPRELLEQVDLLVPNEHEAALLLGEPVEAGTAPQAAQALYRRFGTPAVITLGGQGSVYCGGAAVLRQPAARVSAADTTAAGDSFIGGLCCALAEGKEMAQALRFATAVSAVTVTRPGAISSLPTRAEAENALARLLGGV